MSAIDPQIKETLIGLNPIIPHPLRNVRLLPNFEVKIVCIFLKSYCPYCAQLLLLQDEIINLTSDAKVYYIFDEDVMKWSTLFLPKIYPTVVKFDGKGSGSYNVLEGKINGEDEGNVSVLRAFLQR